MRSEATFIFLAGCCSLLLAAAACDLRAARAPRNPTPAPAGTVAKAPAAPETAANEPLSVPQTQVVLPRPQPIQAEALAPAPPELPPAAAVTAPATKPRASTTTRQEPRPQTQPAGPQPPPATAVPATRRRIRPVESEAERRRMLDEVQGRQRQTQELVAKAKSRPLSDLDRATLDRIQAFLDQTSAALKEKDLQQAEALSNRALLLCHELSPEK